jgi:hypothetical protein
MDCLCNSGLGEMMSARAIVADALTGVKLGVHAQCWKTGCCSTPVTQWMGSLCGWLSCNISMAISWSLEEPSDG